MLLLILPFFNCITFAEDIQKFYTSESLVIGGEETLFKIYIPKGALIYPNCSESVYLYSPILYDKNKFFKDDKNIDIICVKYKGFGFIWGIKNSSFFESNET